MSKWRGRFIRDRLDGLYDEPRPGAQRRITDDQVEDVIVRFGEAVSVLSAPWRPFCV